MKKVTYFDLGVWRGYEIDAFIEIANELQLDYKVIGIEADPILFHGLLEKYGPSNDRITILNAAVTDSVKIEKLYQCAEEGIGNSIFSSKNNVDPEKYHSVIGIPFSHLLTSDNLGDINILKFNIEGAELRLMNDIINAQKENLIDIFCGSTPDIDKVESIRNLRGYYDELLKATNIQVQQFYYTYEQEKFASMKQDLMNTIFALANPIEIAK